MTFDITSTGIWLCKDASPHSFDEPLAKAIHEYLPDGPVLDLGCGDGRYVRYFNHHSRVAAGVDGNPHLKGEGVIVADLTKPIVYRVPCVISLETGEHIPAEYEDVFLDNVTNNARDAIVLSWFPHDGEGIGHVNPRSNTYIKSKMLKRGWVSVELGEKKLRSAATLWWFLHSLMVFKPL